MEPSLRYAYEASDCRMPIIIAMAPGAEPASELSELAESILGSARELRFVSLGHGQGEKACQVIDDCIQRGNWVLLQNCHLAQSWLPSLDRYILRALVNNESEIHSNFRLFLANSMASHMPISLL